VHFTRSQFSISGCSNNRDPYSPIGPGALLAGADGAHSDPVLLAALQTGDFDLAFGHRATADQEMKSEG